MTNERGNARKPAANCENQFWEGKAQKSAENPQETCRKPAGNPQETRRKPAGNLQETCRKLREDLEARKAAKLKPKAKNLGKETCEGKVQ